MIDRVSSGPESNAAPGLVGEVRVFRGAWLESRHRVHAVVVDAEGRVRARVGDAAWPTFFRSAAKPLQAMPLVEDGVVEAFGLDDEALALCCASHNSEARHVDVARRILALAGCGEGDLACGGHPPLRAEEGWRRATEGRRPGPIDSNCSGKHAGMLALAAFHGWGVARYVEADHPVQRRMALEVSRWTGLPVEALETGVDGCGVVCFRVPLDRIARSYARLAARAAEGSPGPARIVGAMTGNPGMVGGLGRLDTAVVEATGGAVFAKVGAEGVYAAGWPGRGLGLALKVEDGAWRAADAALVHLLDRLGVTDPESNDSVAPFRRRVLHNTRGEVVGRLEAAFEPEWR